MSFSALPMHVVPPDRLVSTATTSSRSELARSGHAAAAYAAPAQRKARLRSIAHASEKDQVVTGEGSRFDVGSAVVSPSYRSTPWEAEAREESSSRTYARILFVSESNVCRSVLAETIMRELIAEAGWESLLQCASAGSRDYNVGDPPDPLLVAVAEQLGLRLPEGAAAQQVDFERDIVEYELLLVMDKYTAADVLREVSVYDTISKAGRYTSKVRLLGEYHKGFAATEDPDGKDIDDPLYGNANGPDEQEAIRVTASVIAEACNGLLAFLRSVRGPEGADEGLGEGVGERPPFREQLRDAVRELDAIEWMVPPMLQKR